MSLIRDYKKLQDWREKMSTNLLNNANQAAREDIEKRKAQYETVDDVGEEPNYKKQPRLMYMAFALPNEQSDVQSAIYYWGDGSIDAFDAATQTNYSVDPYMNPTEVSDELAELRRNAISTSLGRNPSVHRVMNEGDRAQFQEITGSSVVVPEDYAIAFQDQF